ncbi:hypothetical protein [Spiroplasma cantharicola]|uniref:Uncharacterized protein n=1 Tax=Spiroplasma cantharicola TaxID=362837 RepID=A0A0M4JX15_9MOLU|nr:hypothetical protein [Spiroplasma cantharicola]ALD66580.1 hypothetical protein SCANT_v1c06740 [Spiroplasma cantharicola]
MRNTIKINANIPYFLQEIEINIASLKELNEFNSRFCLLLAYKNELEDLPPIIDLKEFLKKYFNLDFKMFIFIEDSFKELFKSKTITFKFNDYEKIDSIWKINFNELILNKKIKEKIKNEEYFSLTENFQKKKKIFLSEVLKNKIPKEIESKMNYKKIESNNQKIDFQIQNYLDSNYYETLGESNIKIDHLSQEIQSINLVDNYLTYIEKEHEFIIDEDKNLLPKNRRAEKLIEHIKLGLIEENYLKDIIFEKYNITLKKNNFKEKLKSEIIYPDFEDYNIYLDNILKEEVGIEGEICIYNNNIYLVNIYNDKLKIHDLNQTLLLNRFSLQKIENKYLDFINLENVVNKNLIEILLKDLENKNNYDSIQINFIKANIKSISITEIWFEKFVKHILNSDELRELIKYSSLDLSKNMINLLVEYSDFSYEELYLNNKWEYKEKEIFTNWKKEVNFWKIIKMKNQFDVSTKENLTLEGLKFLKNKIELTDISPIKDLRVDNFYKELNKQIEIKETPTEDKITVRIINLRKKLEQKVGVTKKKTFSKVLSANYEEDGAYSFYKDSYKFLSEFVHGRAILPNDENLEKLGYIEKTLDIVNLKKK